MLSKISLVLTCICVLATLGACGGSAVPPVYSVDNSVPIPVLLYHNVMDKEQLASPESWEYTCTKAQFQENMTTLQKAGYTPLSLLELYTAITENSPLPQKPIVITFDDGDAGQYEIAYPILKKLGMKAAIFVVSHWVGNTVGGKSFFDWDAAREMQESGVIEIYNHSKQHLFYANTPLEYFLFDTQYSFDLLEEQMGAPALRAFAYPYGNHTDEMVNSLIANQVDVQLYTTGMATRGEFDFSYVRRINIEMGQTGNDIIKMIETRQIKGASPPTDTPPDSIPPENESSAEELPPQADSSVEQEQPQPDSSIF